MLLVVVETASTGTVRGSRGPACRSGRPSWARVEHLKASQRESRLRAPAWTASTPEPFLG
eukprot:3865518-Prymnesium_polylepis.1